MANIPFRFSPPLALVLAGAIGLAASPAWTQGLDSEGAIDTIVGSDVKTEEKSAADEGERVIAAIEATMENAQLVRRAFNIDEVDIVFLPEIGEGDSGITTTREEFKDQIVELQQSIEGSAIFYHAVDSRQILVRDIVAVEFGNENRTVTIFVAGAAPAGATAPATTSTPDEGESAPADAEPAATD